MSPKVASAKTKDRWGPRKLWNNPPLRQKWVFDVLLMCLCVSVVIFRRVCRFSALCSNNENVLICDQIVIKMTKFSTWRHVHVWSQFERSADRTHTHTHTFLLFRGSQQAKSSAFQTKDRNISPHFKLLSQIGHAFARLLPTHTEKNWLVGEDGVHPFAHMSSHGGVYGVGVWGEGAV
jgi:hypothetical protein